MWAKVVTLIFTLTMVVAMPSRQEDKNQPLGYLDEKSSACVINSDCPETHGCINLICINTCKKYCAKESVCNVSNHTMTSCRCPEGKIGDPSSGCKSIGEEGARQFCDPPIYSSELDCVETPEANACRCLPGYLRADSKGPKCTKNSDCSDELACVKDHCIDPCLPGVLLGACVYNAECKVFNHSPMCTCPQGTVGNPFHRCFK